MQYAPISCLKPRIGLTRNWLLLLTLMATGLAAAADVPNVWMHYDRSSVHIGTYIANFDTDMLLASDLTGTGTPVNAEDDFGLDDSTTNILLHFDRRFRDRHRVDIAIYDLSRDGAGTVEREIDFGDITIPIGADVDSTFDYHVGKLTYSYSIRQTDAIDLALAAGVYVADYDVDVINLENGDREGEDGFSPFPLVGLRGSYLFSPRLIGNAYIEYLKVNTNDTDATYIDTTVSLEYRLRDRFGVGAAYNFVNIDGEDKDSDDEADFTYNGVLLFLIYNFD